MSFFTSRYLYHIFGGKFSDGLAIGLTIGAVSGFLIGLSVGFDVGSASGRSVASDSPTSPKDFDDYVRQYREDFRIYEDKYQYKHTGQEYDRAYENFQNTIDNCYYGHCASYWGEYGGMSGESNMLFNQMGR